MTQDTIDLCGHWGLGRKAVTHFCEVDKPLKTKKEPRPEDELTRGTTSLPSKNAWHLTLLTQGGRQGLLLFLPCGSGMIPFKTLPVGSHHSNSL